MEKEQIIPDDIFMDSYENYPMGDIRKAYQQGRMEERAKLEYVKVAASKAGAQDAIANHPHKWSDEDMLNFLDYFLRDDDNGRSKEFRIARQRVLEEYKQSKL
jgi:hypothetical protein